MPTAYLGLGSNLGDRHAHLQAAVAGLHEREGLRVVAASPVYETEAHTLAPDEEQPPFYNAVLAVHTTLPPRALLRVAQEQEAAAGRTRDRRWAPRPLDVDILTYGNAVHTTDALTLPHPRLADRRFVLRPWADVAPNLRIPAPFNATVDVLLARCADATPVRRVSATLSAPPSSAANASS
jgi:2-amino-4-hydroxy-6-hydroxymethyldihydropteridine diphosphokinase